MKITSDFDTAMRGDDWLDGRTMYDLSDEQYREYIKATLDVDHHDVFRLMRGSDGGPSLATTLEQMNMLISYLQYLQEKMVRKKE
jgi:hypothetical protein